MSQRYLPVLLLALLIPHLAMAGASDLTPIRMSDNGDFMIPQLAVALGYFQQEGLSLVRVKVEDVAPNDFMMQKPLCEGQIDASFHWFHHTIFGARHNYPVTAVIMLCDAPGLKIMVANRLKGEMRTAADFKGRRVAEGMGYATKSVLTNYVAHRAGLPLYSYTPVFPEEAGRLEAVLQGLRHDSVDIVAFLEPNTSAVLATGLVTTLYDLTTKAGTVQALGAPFPSESILMAPAYIQAHPATVQHVVNAMVRTMRYVNSHTADEVAAQLPATYWAGEDRRARLSYLRLTLSTYARRDYSFSPAAISLVIDTVLTSRFDHSEEGTWRATVENPSLVPGQLYTNEFVRRAMTRFP